MPIDALSVLCAHLTRDLLAIAKLLFTNPYSLHSNFVLLKYLRVAQNSTEICQLWCQLLSCG